MSKNVYDPHDDPADFDGDHKFWPWDIPMSLEEGMTKTKEDGHYGERQSLSRGQRKKSEARLRKRLAEQLFPIMHKRISPKVTCVVCRTRIPNATGHTRRCDTCLAANRSATTVKYCRLCRVANHRQFYKGGWATWAVCEKCEGGHLEVYKKAKKAANAAAAAAMAVLGE